MTIKKRKVVRSADLSMYPVWEDYGGDQHLPNAVGDLSYVSAVPLGMFDPENLYPHLLTMVRGRKVVVPLGPCGPFYHDREYEVLPFHYQPLPQREIHWGRGHDIWQVNLSGRLKDTANVWEGLIRTLDTGNLELRCVSNGGLEQWVPIPRAYTNKPAGRIYQKWEIIVPPRDGDDGPQVMVRYNGHDFEHWQGSVL